jgi:hypothetical protein
LHGLGITSALVLKSVRWQPLVRAAGAVCVVVGLALAVKIF